MLKDVRRHAGLGDPPEPFYNNVPESANAQIKRAVNFKENEMSKFCEEMKVLLLSQKEDVDSAIINHGPYRLAPNFSNFALSPDQWFRKNSQQKEAHVKKFHGAKMSVLSINSSPTPPLPFASPETPEIEISVDLASVGITSASPTTLRNISAKAKMLLNKVNAIIQAPTGTGEQAYMVESETMARPHYVSVAKNGKVTCADCPGWNAFKVCSHSLAVAEKTERTADYIKWLRDKGPKGPNLTSLMTCDSGKGVGKKSRKASTARRKGGRSSNNAPPTTVVERLPIQPTATTVTPNLQAQDFADSSLRERSTDQQHTPERLCFTGFSNISNVNEQPPHREPQPPHEQPQCSYQQPQLPYQQPQPLHHQFQRPHQQPPFLHHFPYIQPSNDASPSMINPSYSNQAEPIRIQLLQLCSRLVRTCFGCSQSLKPQGRIAAPPCDMVLTTKMYRQWADRNTGEMRQSFQNVYFHVNARCVRMKQPYFTPQMALLPEAVALHLTPVHINYLRDFGLAV